MKPTKSSMQPAAAGLDKLVLQSLRKSPASEAPLLAWPVACGSAVADRTHAVAFEEGILRVEVPDAGWRRELQVLAPRYLAALNRYLKGKVTAIEFVVAGRKRAASVSNHKNSRSKRA
jgi:hypothetical protein